MIFKNLAIYSILLLMKQNSGAKEIIWRSFEEFKTDWKSTHCEDGTGYGFEKPSSVNSILTPLDATSTQGVWSGTQKADIYNFLLDWTSSQHIPKNCSLTSANLTIRYYFNARNEDEESGSDEDYEAPYIYLFPVLHKKSKGRISAFDEKNQGLNWTSKTVRVDTNHCRQSIQLGSGGYPDENGTLIHLLDEVRFSYDGTNC